jgi:hypothetical protein
MPKNLTFTDDAERVRRSDISRTRVPTACLEN